MTVRLGRYLFGLFVVAGGVVLDSNTAHAHPLGNFSVNRSHQLSLTTGRFVNRAVVDFAEIPTAQARSIVDADNDDQVSPAELARHGEALCASVRSGAALVIDGVAVPLTTAETSFVYEAGQAGLSTSRLECRLEAAVDFTSPRRLDFSDGSDTGRVGWREISIAGDGVTLVDSPVPESSPTGSLRVYPTSLLESPVNVRSVSLSVLPGDATAQLVEPGGRAPFVTGGPISRATDGLTQRFNQLVGRRDLTPQVGLLAVLLAMVLGASHALLPGHGKTVMAAYIAGRQGSLRDASLVAATVTATHTGGVLLVGLALTLSTSLAGDTVLGWLGVASGVLIAGLGAALLVNAVRHRTPSHGHSHHGHDHHGHDHHGHDHHGHDHHGHDLTPHVSRRGLVGMGVAGGLVPSPSALIVLLSAVALGRTAFGVILVIGYGIGMAATLMVAGLLLVGVRDRLQRTWTFGQRWTALTPYATGLLVLVVGAGLIMRSIATI